MKDKKKEDIKSLRENPMTTKNKTHQELVKEIWDDADRSFIKAFDEPLDESLKDMYPDAFPTPTVNEKTKKREENLKKGKDN